MSGSKRKNSPNINPLVSLTFSIHENKGVYALLLGSGVSRAAEIPTSWEIVIDLIRKLAKLEGEDDLANPIDWYVQQYNERPQYDTLLDGLCNTSADRMGLLRGYIDPTEEEQKDGKKQATLAHHAIAKLVKSGHIKVILTTNFDRLLEQALQLEGIQPTVLSSPDAHKGAIPLAHSGCTIIKLHGDYMDIRSLNTPDELEEYDSQINDTLDRIFDEYGLIICGWSSEYDTALRNALDRCKNHRFTTYWATRGEPVELAEGLIQRRRAKEIEIEDADSFFGTIFDNVSVLRDMDAPHPLSAKMLIVTTKRLISDEQQRIVLRDLVSDETVKLVENLNEDNFPLQAPVDGPQLLEHLKRYEAFCAPLISLIGTGCYWGKESQRDIWSEALTHVVKTGEPWSDSEVSIDFKKYPSLLLFYAGCIAAIAGKNFHNLYYLMEKVEIGKNNSKNHPCEALGTSSVFCGGSGKLIPDFEKRLSPANDYLFEALKSPLKDIIKHESDYEFSFDRFELMHSLNIMYHKKISKKIPLARIPIGRFMYKGMYKDDYNPYDLFVDEIRSSAANIHPIWPPLAAGLYGGTVTTALDALTEYETIMTPEIENKRYR